MTADMAFECLLVSRDQGVICTMNKLLENLSISTKVCPTRTSAFHKLSEGSVDLIVVDWEKSSADFIHAIRQSAVGQKPTVVVVTPLDHAVPGSDSLIRKPIVEESAAKSLRVAYSRMLHDHRRYKRYGLLVSLTALDRNDALVPVVVVNIGAGGVALSSNAPLAIGDALSFRLQLPGTERSIYIKARVLWTRQYGEIGCEFLRMLPVDLEILNGWLEQRCQIKQPLVDL